MFKSSEGERTEMGRAAGGQETLLFAGLHM